MTVTSEGRQTPPLAPGRLPGIGHLAALLRNPLAFMKSLTQVDNVVTLHLGKRTLYVLNSHELVRTILVSEAEKCTRGVIFEKASKVLGQGLICAEGELHKKQRRLLQPSFNQHPIERYSTAMIEVAAAESRSWEPGRGGVRGWPAWAVRAAYFVAYMPSRRQARRVIGMALRRS